MRKKKGISYDKNQYSLEKYQLNYEKVGEEWRRFSFSLQNAPTRINRLAFRLRKRLSNLVYRPDQQA